MDSNEKLLFDALSEHRGRIASALLEEDCLAGVKRSVVEKYSEKAHFIYELLQNADDTKAKHVWFKLEHDRLVFIHDGTRHFSVSNCTTEKIDRTRGKLGDVNAIASIGNSNKDAYSIGKFGVGFKAVFLYTSTPHIYDPNFQFKIERFLVPILLDEDFPGREKDKTVFVFPFDITTNNDDSNGGDEQFGYSKEVAFEDISAKLQNLSYPTLFLTNLERIDYEFDGIGGSYIKNVIEKQLFDDTTTAELVEVSQNNTDTSTHENIWIFSRSIMNNLRYSVGFFMDDNGHLIPVDKTAFCYFPTQKETKLHFIIHAPFLLNDSREGILDGDHNRNMINLLADLSADSLEYMRDIGIKRGMRLIDDNIVSIIPINKKIFLNSQARNGLSFFPFYTAILNKFKNSPIIPTINGYTETNNAYWAAVPRLTTEFSDSQLAEIVWNRDAKWVFRSMGRDEQQRSYDLSLVNYVDSIVKTFINEDTILSGRYGGYSNSGVPGITSYFIEKQSISWLCGFHGWISETSHRTSIVRKKPVFLNQDGKAVAAYDSNDHHILFLPKEGMDGYSVIHNDLLNNENSRKLIEALHITEPEMKDYIYNIVLPQFRNHGVENISQYFKIFFDYYCTCPRNECNSFTNMINKYEFLLYMDNKGITGYGSADTLYMPTDILKKYFETKDNTRFVDLDRYKESIGNDEEKLKLLEQFLIDLGVSNTVRVFYNQKIENIWCRYEIPASRHPRVLNEVTESVIDGCKDIINFTADNRDESKSAVLWRCLIDIIKSKWGYGVFAVGEIFSGCRKCFCSNKTTRDEFPSLDTKYLKEKSWIQNKSGGFVLSNTLNIDEIPDIYDTSSEYALWLIEFLGIRPRMETIAHNSEEYNSEYYSKFTEKEAEYLKNGKALDDVGGTPEEFKEYLEVKRKEKECREEVSSESSDSTVVNGLYPSKTTANTSELESLFEETEGGETSNQKRIKSKKAKEVLIDIVRKSKKISSNIRKSVQNEDSDDDIDENPDGVTRRTVSIGKRIERAKEKSSREIDNIVSQGVLEERANTLPRYSYGWFTTLLEMESLCSNDSNRDSKEISIHFEKVEKEPGTKRTLVLKNPNRYIPQFMEDLSDISLVLHMQDETTKSVPIDVASIKSYTLRVKMKNSTDVDNIDLSSVTEATINTKSPSFLLDELLKQFSTLNLEENYDMRENLCANIDFVFGPPGTGKTTYLAKDILIPLMKKNQECKILVLTPTNKSADVLVRRIMEVSGEDLSYNEWLVRFGTTCDEDIEGSKVYKDKTFDITSVTRNITVTTIARFPYDYFMPGNSRVFLHGINWDYIVIDEASMIPLANIILPLYMKTPKKFIIAGDPFQIQPITAIDLWKDENIYTMVGLDSFTDPKTNPNPYPVTLLTTQYRSIPEIGNIFSKFAYGGILSHNRSSESQRKLNLPIEFGIKTLNIIKFPVSKYESIYRCKRLQHSSSYQVYSALFTYEYVCYLARAIAQNNPENKFKIGVIAPYRAQADLISKLVASESIPKEIDVQVGTIHGFQGDECDIIFAVFNSPPTISTNKEMFLNNRNIINVSISRSRDYLFVIMPDDNTENVDNLNKIKRVEALIKDSDGWSEHLSPELEEQMFGDSHYLENNAFSTSHQSVNVYGLPEKRYEVRTEDSAVDVQIHKDVKNVE